VIDQAITTTAVMAEYRIIKATGGKNSDRTRAKEAVFGIYEILESIMLAARPKDISAIAQVNKACHNITTASKPVNKHLMLSDFFNANVKSAKKDHNMHITSADMRLGRVLVRRVLDQDIIVAKRYHWDGAHVGYERPICIFLSETEQLPGLTSGDRALLRGGLAKGLRDCKKIGYRRLTRLLGSFAGWALPVHQPIVRLGRLISTHEVTSARSCNRGKVRKGSNREIAMGR
jgi:hypothetical protein